MPTAKVGAPPVRERIDSSPTSCAICVSISGVTTKPQDEIVCAACTAVVPITAAELLSAKYTPGSNTAAATNAITATKDSINIAP